MPLVLYFHLTVTTHWAPVMIVPRVKLSVLSKFLTEPDDPELLKFQSKIGFHARKVYIFYSTLLHSSALSPFHATFFHRYFSPLYLPPPLVDCSRIWIFFPFSASPGGLGQVAFPGFSSNLYLFCAGRNCRFSLTFPSH